MHLPRNTHSPDVVPHGDGKRADGLPGRFYQPVRVLFHPTCRHWQVSLVRLGLNRQNSSIQATNDRRHFTGAHVNTKEHARTFARPATRDKGYFATGLLRFIGHSSITVP